jgi:serine O-acetyltransferase
MMRVSMGAAELDGYITRLLAGHLPDGVAPRLPLRRSIERALERVEHCFGRIHRKYYTEPAGTVFDHLNADHMASFLWFLGNMVWRDHGDAELPTRLFYLNKIMHGIDLFYSVEMPDVFLLVHPVGTVLGRAQYSDYLVVYQNCTVGADGASYPSFGEEVILYSRTSVLGSCTVGRNVVFAANSFIVNTDVPDDTTVVGQYPAQRLLPNAVGVRERCFSALPVATRAAGA